MLTPEYIESLSYNKVIAIYDQLNIDICSDIIRRINSMGDISSATKRQLKVLLKTNGDEIFKNVLLQTQSLNKETKEALTKIYENMAKEDMKGYKELFEYRDKPFKLSTTQLKILNYGIKDTKGILSNFTKTIAFSSKELYVSAVDRAYRQVVTGAIDYSSAIYNAYQNLAEQGVTLKDSIGRNVKLDIAVRRNILTGIKQTADNINRDVDKELGCDGIETTAHSGARPSHQVWQGKQFALTKGGTNKYELELWSKSLASEEINDYNCRHTYFGIILGVSEPVYSKKELNTLKNEEVTYNGTKMPLYEANEKMRYIERNIREFKRQRNTYKKANLDDLYKKANLKVSEWQQKYTDFTNQTGIDKDYDRTRI